MTFFNDYDDTRVVLCDGAISVDGIMISASRSFVRDVRLANPTPAMQKAAYWRDAMTPQHITIPEGYKYCQSGLKHAAPFEDAILPRDEFGNDHTQPDGKRRICTACRNEQERRAYARQHNAVVRLYRRREWE